MAQPAFFVTTTADAPGTNRFEITLERGKLVAEHDKLTFFELEQSERDFCFTATGGFEQPAGHEVTIELDGENPQHVGVLNALQARSCAANRSLQTGPRGSEVWSFQCDASFLLDRPDGYPADR